MTLRRQLRDVLVTPRSVSWLARELGLTRGDVEQDLEHAIRSARAAGDDVQIEPARCKECGFVFDRERLSKTRQVPGVPGHQDLRAARIHRAEVGCRPERLRVEECPRHSGYER